MNVTNKINIDLTTHSVIPRIDAVQFDENSRVIEISLYSGGIAWEIPDGAEIAISYRKPDNTSGLYDTLPDENQAYTFSGNMISAMLAPQMLTVSGLVSVAVIMYSGSAQLATFPFTVNVQPNPSADGGVSNDYYNYQTIGALNEAIGDLNKLNTSDKSSLVAAINEAIKSGGGGGDSSQNPADGEDGGYYIPAVTQVDENTIRISYTPSKENMPAVDSQEIVLPEGKDGYSPVRGTDYWTDADIAEIKSYVDEAILGGAW